ncbi:hypothetical protein ACF09H_32280 [Streptomyces sp. NPDC014983]
MDTYVLLLELRLLRLLRACTGAVCTAGIRRSGPAGRHVMWRMSLMNGNQ